MNVTLTVVSSPAYVAAGRDCTVVVAVQNREPEPLHSAGPAPLHLSYHWRQSEEQIEPLRTTFWRPVAPGDTEFYDVRIQAPMQAGKRELAITLVRESVRWFDHGEDAVVAACTLVVVAAGEAVPFETGRYERSRRSQNGEDGIIAELLLRVGWRDRFLVEFGSSDGFECNSATLIEEYGWGGLLIEGDGPTFERLGVRFGGRRNLALRKATITKDNIATIFCEAAVPAEFDLLSIDIDGNDYWIWAALGGYRPRIVIIEYNAFYVPPRRWVMAYDPTYRWTGTTHHGASLASLALLGNELGYALVGTDGRGVNAFFVRADLLEASLLVAREAADVYTAPAIRHTFEAGPFVEI